MWFDVHVEALLNIKRSSRNLAAMGITEKKTTFLDNLVHTFIKYLYSIPIENWTTLYPALSTQILLFTNKVRLIFALKLYHEKRAENFFKLGFHLALTSGN